MFKYLYYIEIVMLTVYKPIKKTFLKNYSNILTSRLNLY